MMKCAGVRRRDVTDPVIKSQVRRARLDSRRRLPWRRVHTAHAAAKQRGVSVAP